MNIIKGIKKRYFSRKRFKVLRTAEELLKQLNFERPDGIPLKQGEDQSDSATLTDELIHYFQQRSAGRFILNPNDKLEILKLLQAKCPEEKQAVIQAADQICQHEITCFPGLKWCFPDHIDWHTTFHTGGRWPLIPAHKIDCRSPDRPGDVKLIWELNRHQYLHSLGKAYWYTGESQYLDEAKYQITDWIEHNPVGIGINWESTLEVSIRLISWCWIFYYFKDQADFYDSFFVKFLTALFEQAQFIYLNLTDWGNNHVIGESTGLLMASLLFPEFKLAVKWRERSRRVLEQEIEKQVFNDGVSKEKSICYHRFVLDFYLLAACTAQMNQLNLSPPVLQRMQSMVEALCWLGRPTGQWSNFGDNDSSQGLIFSTKPNDAYALTAGVGSWFFKNKCFPIHTAFTPNLIWFLGTKYPELEALQTNGNSRATKKFSASGLMIFRNSWQRSSDYLLFDAGPMGLPPAFSHAHSDRLHFELIVGGEPLFTDSGTFTYNGAVVWRNFFRSAAAHNTIRIKKSNQAKIEGTFCWTAPPQMTAPILIENQTMLLMSGAYCLSSQLLNPAPKHRRLIILLKPSDWLIIDVVEEIQNYEVAYFFQCAPEVICEKVASQQYQLKTGFQAFTLAYQNSNAISDTLYWGCEAPLAGWFSPTYGKKIPRPTLQLQVAPSKERFQLNVAYLTKVDQKLATYPLKFELNHLALENSQKIALDNTLNRFGLSLTLGAKFVTIIINLDRDKLYFNEQVISAPFFIDVKGQNKYGNDGHSDKKRKPF